MDTKLNNMIDRSSNVTLKENDFWYSYANQKKLKYNLAVQILLHCDVSVKEAIQMSEDFHNKFYDTAFNMKDKT